jgi:hypothetical protein
VLSALLTEAGQVDRQVLGAGADHGLLQVLQGLGEEGDSSCWLARGNPGLWSAPCPGLGLRRKRGAATSNWAALLFESRLAENSKSSQVLGSQACATVPGS